MTRRRTLNAIIATFVLFTASIASAAAEPAVNPGVRIGQWITDNVTALFAPLLGVISLYYLARREFTKFLSFAAFAVLAGLLIFGGAEFKDAAVGLGKWIIGK